MKQQNRLNNIEREQLLKRKLKLATPLLIVMISIPILGFFDILNFFKDEPQIWFQRSGSLMVMFGLLIEYTLFSIDDELFSIGSLSRKQTKLLNKYQIHYASLKYLGITGAVAGTVIWGYGDLFWLYWNEAS